jgi:uncharacterized SAM-binding protein YcdF (DUF218 family)
MFFILSKILLFLLSPAFWIIVFLVWSFFTKRARRKKILRITCIVLFLVFTNEVLFNVCVRAWQPEPVDIPKGKTYSAAILLGGMTATDRYNRSYFGPDADRFIQTTMLYHSGIVKYIAVSGGSGALLQKGPLEADQLRLQLLKQGISDSAILIENRSRNTYENAVYTKQIFDSLKLPPPYVLVTSAMHARRAMSSFRKAGFDVMIYPAAYKQIPNKRTWDDYVVPSTGLLAQWSFFLKEVVGLMVYRWTGKA